MNLGRVRIGEWRKGVPPVWEIFPRGNIVNGIEEVKRFFGVRNIFFLKNMVLN
jgi:hypothetical protein